MLSKVTDSKRTRRRQRRKAFGSQFRFDISQTAIYFLLDLILVCRQFSTGIRPFVRILLILTKSFLLFFLRMQHATNQLDNPVKINGVKKDIARIKTILREKALRPEA